MIVLHGEIQNSEHWMECVAKTQIHLNKHKLKHIILITFEIHLMKWFGNVCGSKVSALNTQKFYAKLKNKKKNHCELNEKTFQSGTLTVVSCSYGFHKILNQIQVTTYIYFYYTPS